MFSTTVGLGKGSRRWPLDLMLCFDLHATVSCSPSAPLNCLQVRGEVERRTHGPAAAELEMVDLHRSSTTARAY